MKVSIAIPCYNEEKTIKLVIDKVKELRINKEIIVVDDCSTDGSYEIIKNTDGIKFYRHEKNLGKGGAVKTALKYSTGDIFLIQDADLELDPIHIPLLIEPIILGKAEVVYGTRNNEKNDRHNRSPIFYFGGLFVTLLTNFLYDIKITDEACGYKVFKKRIIDSINIENSRFEWEPEITAKIARKGIKIYEVPVTSTARSTFKGKKLKRRDGLKAIWTLIKYRFKT
jgi:glycosyltransferase involved in cell wall biosynthesis